MIVSFLKTVQCTCQIKPAILHRRKDDLEINKWKSNHVKTEDRRKKIHVDDELITRPSTLPLSRGRVGRSGIAKKRSHFVLVTDGPTDRPTDTASSRVASPRLKI